MKKFLAPQKYTPGPVTWTPYMYTNRRDGAGQTGCQTNVHTCQMNSVSPARCRSVSLAVWVQVRPE